MLVGKYTKRARWQLVFSPFLMLVLALCTLASAFTESFRAFGEKWWWETRDDFRWLYRDVYRVARYGRVWDK